MNSYPIRVLLVEDDLGDADLLRSTLSEDPDAEIELEHAQTLSQAFERLDSRPADVVLLDLNLPDVRRQDTVSRMLSRAPALATVVLTGYQDEARAVQALQEGAQDYLVKGQVDAQSLIRSMRYAIERKRSVVERDHLIAELKEALAKVKMLTGLLPICSSCRKIREDGSWSNLEDYVRHHSEADFSHGICPECAHRLYPGVFEKGDTLT